MPKSVAELERHGTHTEKNRTCRDSIANVVLSKQIRQFLLPRIQNSSNEDELTAKGTHQRKKKTFGKIRFLIHADARLPHLSCLCLNSLK